MSKHAVSYHPMDTAPTDGTMVRLCIRALYVGCPTEVLGSWTGYGWQSDQSLDDSRDINPTGWSEL